MYVYGMRYFNNITKNISSTGIIRNFGHLEDFGLFFEMGLIDLAGIPKPGITKIKHWTDKVHAHAQAAQA